MKEEKQNRVSAIRWWKELHSYDKLVFCKKNMPEDRDYRFLTGREIEKIYNSTKRDKS